MKAVIVNCFDTYEDRVDLISEFLKQNNYEVQIIQSDFRHIKKAYRQDRKQDYQFIKTKRYNKNLSMARLYSHYIFSKDAFKLVEKIKPDLLYVFVPPNSLTKFALKYKKKTLEQN